MICQRTKSLLNQRHMQLLQVTHIYVAGNAVDRDIRTCMRTDPIGKNSDYYRVWWKVDLGAVYNIYSVNILFKNYDGYGNFFRA